MSDPYGNNPYGNDPYSKPPQGGQGQPGQNPYSPPAQPTYGGGNGGGGYGGGYGGGGYPGGSDPIGPKTDGISIAALVLSFLCCLAPIGVILGIVGISRTKGGQRKGRGLAIAAIVVGILMSILVGVLVAVGVFFANKVVTPDNAEVGQCIDVDENDDTVFLYDKDCDGDHDAEIIGVEDVTSDNIDTINSDMVGFCDTLLSDEDRAKLAEVANLEISAVTEDPDDISTGDTIVCYAEGDLDGPIL
ncbi:DUF4190 domain-containing protein [Nocardioides caeni]|uniref:DUF4190 domain-containing protein n=1 Tax=Nocardioides caeni TaxID=574700 RepID=UPI0013051F0F|nr:DUF4190 domain-containing protein [Nocardioides caeni]